MCGVCGVCVCVCVSYLSDGCSSKGIRADLQQNVRETGGGSHWQCHPNDRDDSTRPPVCSRQQGLNGRLVAQIGNSLLPKARRWCSDNPLQ